MPIPLTQPQVPSAKLPTIGAGIEIAVIGTRRRPWTEFGTGAVKVGQDGRPREQLVVTGIVVSHQSAMVGDGTGVERPPGLGEVLTLWLHSHNWFSYIEANKAHGTINVGDVMLWHYTHDEPSQQGGNPKKVRKVTFRRPRPDEAPIVARAEQLYFELGFDKPDAGPSPQAAQAPPAPAQGYGQQPLPYGQQAPAQPSQAGYPGQPQPQGYPNQPQPQPQGYPAQNVDPNRPGFDPGF